MYTICSHPHVSGQPNDRRTIVIQHQQPAIAESAIPYPHYQKPQQYLTSWGHGNVENTCIFDPVK